MSAICQRALEQSVRRVTAIRATALGDLENNDPAAGLQQFTDRTRAVLRLAIEQARTDGVPEVGTEHLLHGMLAEGQNLALQVLRAMELDPEQVRKALAGRAAGPVPGQSSAARFSSPAANALELTVIEALGLGHNYVGCEHLLLGLIGESDGTAGEVLRETGADLRSTRRAVTAALSGYAHLRAQAGAPPEAATMITGLVRKELAPLIERIEQLERQSLTP